MGVKFIQLKMSDIAKSNYFLTTFQYAKLKQHIEDNSYLFNTKIGEFFDIISGFAFSSKDYTDEGVLLCRIGDISKNNQLLTDEMIRLPNEYLTQYEKFRIYKNDILIGLTGDGRYFKTCLFYQDKEILLNQRVAVLRLKPNVFDISIKFVSYLFNLEEIQNQIKIVAMGKTQKNVSPFDVINIKIPNINKAIQDDIIAQIEVIEKEITQLKNSKTPILDIINQVFGEEFGFDWQEFKRLKAQKVFTLKLSNFSNNLDCRMGVRFHNLAGEYLHLFLSKMSDRKIKDFLAEPIVLGTSVSPSDYDETGEYYYIAMSNIKTWAFDDEDCKKVSDTYSQNNQNKTLQKNDILLARSGEGTIGKVALIDVDEINAIFADFTQRIRLTGFNPLCAYYYFRSDFFQYLIYTHKKGLGNNTNIFPSQIQELPMPNWNKEKQSEVVKKIKVELEKQQLIELQVEEKQKEISKLIELTIKKDPILDI